MGGNHDEICEAYENLTEMEHARLFRAAQYCLYGTEYADPLELLSEALLRTLAGVGQAQGRHWPTSISFMAFLITTMQSISDASHRSPLQRQTDHPDALAGDGEGSEAELSGYLRNMLLDTKRSIYEHVIYDSDTERKFADDLEKTDGVVLYAKLPSWFKVPTPLGSYNPDWAILFDQDGTQRLYFVVETKSSLFTDDLRSKEDAKIECGKAHFAALGVGESPAKYLVATSLGDVLKTIA